jgi:hypothetical protein
MTSTSVPEPTPAPSRRRLALGWLIAFAALWTQLIFALTIEEPYPGVVFPGFGSAPKSAELPTTATIIHAHIEAQTLSGQRLELAPEALYEGPHAAARSVMLSRTCPQPAQAEAKRVSRAKHGHKPHFKLKVYIEDTLRGGYVREHHHALGPWLIARAQRVLGQPVEQVQIMWRQRQIELSTQRVLSDQPLHTCAWSAQAPPADPEATP